MGLSQCWSYGSVHSTSHCGLVTIDANRHVSSGVAAGLDIVWSYPQDHRRTRGGVHPLFMRRYRIACLYSCCNSL